MRYPYFITLFISFILLFSFNCWFYSSSKSIRSCRYPFYCSFMCLWWYEMVEKVLWDVLDGYYWYIQSSFHSISLFSLLSHHLSISIPVRVDIMITIHTHDDNMTRYPCYDA